ncbi:TIGR03915 family putative DNA repair protein [Sediminicola sp. 1XM1-17]|uniref:TIGR03915 family putative DNA repair protein n=1 Tax=Sediminicola sp. 1XM1-17 TaxID=3127702 RepID=UPI0030787DD9
MENAKILIYDGSFNGFLTTIFRAFDAKWKVLDIQKDNGKQKELFTELEFIGTNVIEAKRVWNGIEKKGHETIKTIYFAYQSEAKGIEFLLFRFIKQLFTNTMDTPLYLEEEGISKIRQLAKAVGIEKRHMEAFVDMHQSRDSVYFAVIAPDYDILPLISKHFRSKYRDKHWLIYDSKRAYGIYYEGYKVELITLDLGNYYKNPELYSNISKNERSGVTDISVAYLKNIVLHAHIQPKPSAIPKHKDYSPFFSERTAV